MELQFLEPQKNIVNISGKLSYSESIQAWNIIRFKKELVNEFPQLKEKLSKFSYSLVFYPNYNQLEKAVRRLKREKSAIPVLLWMVKEKKIQ